MELTLKNFRCWEDKKINFPAKGLVLLNGASGSGKCFARDTELLMMDGTLKKVQDILVGDKLIGDDSTPRTVLNTCSGVDELYKVTQEEGISYTVNSNHILSLVLHGNYKDDVVDICVKDYIKSSDRIKAKLRGYRNKVDFPERHVYTEPYVKGTIISFQQLHEYPLESEYKINSRRIRLELLAGIIDSVGSPVASSYVLKRGSAFRESFISQVKFIALSLGFYVDVSIDKLEIKIYGKGIEDIPLITRNNKIARNIGPFNENLLTKISVESVGVGSYYGFETDGNHRFLLSDFTVTHNSSILNSIQYLVTGKVKNISNLLSKKSSTVVELYDKGKDVKIIRSRGPNKLLLYKQGVLYEEENAQSVINNLYGKHFTSISYVQQDDSLSFINMSPSDKMEFLEELLLKEQGVNLIKDKIKNEATLAKELFTKEEGKVSVLKQIIMKPAPLPKLKGINSKNYLLKKEETILALQRQESELESVEKDWKNRERLSILKNTVESLRADMGTYSDTSKDLESITLKKAELKQKFGEAKKAFDSFERYTEQKKINSEKLSRLKQKDILKNITLEEMSRVVSLRADIDRYDRSLLSPEKYDRLVNEIENIKTELKEAVYKCPSCDVYLTISENNLVVSEVEDGVHESRRISDTEKIALEERLKKLTRKCEDHERDTELYNACFSELEEHIPDTEDWEKIDETFTVLQEIHDLENNLYEKQLLKEAENALTKEEVKQIEAEYIKSVEACIQLSDKKNRFDDMSIKLKQAEAEMSKLTISTKGDVREDCEALKLQIKQSREFLRSIEDWERILDTHLKYIELKEKVDSAENNKEKLSKRISSLTKLKNHVKVAESKSVMEFIDSLNFHASLYLEHFFNGGIQVILKTHTITSGGSEKISLNFDVTYKGMTDCDLSILSGGERDRVNLAYTLVLSELTGARMLMVDELISSLDSETCSQVMGAIKEKYLSGRDQLVICIAHNVTKGEFENVVEL